MSKFQIILLVVFGVAIVAAVGTFSLYKGGSGSTSAQIVVWGDISSQNFNLLKASPHFSQDRNLTISYVQKTVSSIEREFTEALAVGTGPDLIILTQDLIWKNRAKLVAIPYTSLNEGDFKSTFVEEGELFLSPAGVYALPITIDPMVLYYNRDVLSSAGMSRPMTHWDEIYQAAASLSKKDVTGNIVSTVMALGEARNIPNFKKILSLLFIQAGTPITTIQSGALTNYLATPFGLTPPPGESALNFYTQFSNPTRTYYSWNRSLVDAQTHFTSGDSAYYLGFASELPVIRSKNPTLNLGVAGVPQSRTSGRVVTYGDIRGVAISRGTANVAGALSAALKLVSQESAAVLSEVMGLPPARRDLLARRPSDAISSTFYEAALQSKGWIDPDTVATETIFREAIESVTNGRLSSGGAITTASRQLDILVK